MNKEDRARESLERMREAKERKIAIKQKQDKTNCVATQMTKKLGAGKIAGLMPKEHRAKVKSIVLKQIIQTRKLKNVSSTVPLLTEANALTDHILGNSQVSVEAAYGLHCGKVQKLMNRTWPDKEQREEALENILLQNAIISAAIFEEKASELTAPQAAIAAGIFTERFSGLKKARQNNFTDSAAPVSLILQLSTTLEDIKKTHGKVIDLED